MGTRPRPAPHVPDHRTGAGPRVRGRQSPHTLRGAFTGPGKGRADRGLTPGARLSGPRTGSKGRFAGAQGPEKLRGRGRDANPSVEPLGFSPSLREAAALT